METTNTVSGSDKLPKVAAKVIIQITNNRHGRQGTPQIRTGTKLFCNASKGAVK